MVGVRVPLVVEGRRGSVRDNDSLARRRGSGVNVKPLLKKNSRPILIKKNSRPTLIKKNSRPKIKTFQVSIQLEGEGGEEERGPKFVKRGSIQKICLPSSDISKPLFSKKGSVHKICLPPSENTYDLSKPQFRKRRSVTALDPPLVERKTAVLPSSVHRRATHSKEQVARDERQCEEGLRGIALGDFTQFQVMALKFHNQYRSKHRVSPLQLDSKLCEVAQEYADFLATTNQFEHSGDSVHGENLYWGWSSEPSWVLEAEEVVTSWYKEKKGYDYLSEPRDTESGHFTQLVWAHTNTLGVGLAKSPTTGRYMTVMKYYPPGNYVGQYLQNVLPPVATKR